MEDWTFPGLSWPPRVSDYVHVNATGETARIVAVSGAGYDQRFTIELLPRPGDAYDPRRLIRRTCALDKLSPEAPPPRSP